MEHCGKHDITYQVGAQCWCCEESAMTKEDRARNYSDPAFLAKRGGAGAHAQAVISNAVQKLSALSAEQLERLLALAGAGAGTQTAGSRKPI